MKDYLITFVRLLLGIDQAVGSGHLSCVSTAPNQVLMCQRCLLTFDDTTLGAVSDPCYAKHYVEEHCLTPLRNVMDTVAS